ncbi:MAG: hypothetical protein IPJ19_10020 [Planctomycetes bacterium]|nr:hypothetical protein [Planctomycetota bacterium]
MFQFRSRASFARSALLAQSLLAAAALTAAGCGGWGSVSPGSSNLLTPSGTPGAILAQPLAQLSAHEFARTLVVDENQGGARTQMHLTGAWYGRLVDVLDETGALQNTNLVVGEEIRTDGVDFAVRVNAHTGRTSVQILHAAQSREYQDAFRRLESNLTPIAAKGLDPAELPPFPLVPRDAAILLRFDDLVDAASLRPDTLRIAVGTPPLTAFPVRLLRDVNHGDLLDADGDGQLEFHTTRVILDTTVSELEATQSADPLPIQELGLPASENASQANVALLIPTRADPSAGQTALLTNLSGHGLASAGNGPVAQGSATRTLVRALRSGGAPSDSNHGFLAPAAPARVVGSQAAHISTPTGSSGNFLTNVDFDFDPCSQVLKTGDILSQAGVLAQVLQDSGVPVGGTVNGVNFQILSPLGGSLSAGPVRVNTSWDPVVDAGLEGCFVTYTAQAAGATQPGQGVSSDARVLVRFSQPIDPASMSAFGAMPILRVDPASAAPGARDFVVGEVAATSASAREFAFAPVAPFAHTLGSASDAYFLALGSGSTGPLDLSGNPLADALPAVRFTIDAADATEQNAGLVFRFSSTDELGNDGKPEWRGQFLLDLAQGTANPRPVTRLRATCDRTLPIPGNMASYPSGVQTPMTGLGARLQSLWRYCDVGLGLLDESTCNVDIEHLYWAPAGGAVVADSYSLFEMRLSHTKFLPDESVSPSTLLPMHPRSGLSNVFARNVLDGVQDPQRVVHDRSLGYVVDPADQKLAATGAETIMPFPLNQGVPISQYQYYTWRDTAVLSKGAVGDSPGAELRSVCSILFGTGSGTCVSCPYTNFSGNNPAPSIALPLLMEFRCFPDSGALGVNSLDVNLAVNSSATPNFRAFSAGGVNTAGQTIVVNPDLASHATGGFNPNSVPPGQPTLGVDNVVQLGEMDLVLRVSRMHSIWLDTQFNAPHYFAPVVEPREADQPAGTSVRLDYRGATQMQPPTAANIATDANFIDMYGNAALCNVIPPPLNSCGMVPCTTNGVPTFLGGAAGLWRSSLSQIDGAKLFQVRVTFVSNTATNLSPKLSALGFAYGQ